MTFTFYMHLNPLNGFCCQQMISVSKDIKVNGDTGVGYYEAEATITVRGSAKGEKTAEFIPGMAVRAKLVTGEKSVLRYLLEKIDLVDE